MLKITPSLSKLLEFRRRGSVEQHSQDVNDIFELDGVKLIVDAVVELEVEDDSDYDREYGYGNYSHKKVVDVSFRTVENEETGEVLYNSDVRSPSKLSDEQLKALEGMVEEKALKEFEG